MRIRGKEHIHMVKASQKKQNRNGMQVGNFNLAKPAERARLKSLMVELVTQTQALTKKDIRNWRNAWQMAINVEQPVRALLYDIYTDVEIDMHLTGCVGQRKGFVQKKSFMLVDTNGKKDDKATELLESSWFKTLISHILDSRYWGHSLIQLGDIVTEDGRKKYRSVELVPRKHVVPEYGVIIREQGDEWQTGYDYRNSDLSEWVIEAGNPKDLGLYLKAATQTIPKKNMLGYWDTFGEMFGMPIRIGKTSSRDVSEVNKVEDMLANMGAAAWGLFPEGTEIEIKETTRGDAYNVYDKRIDRANGELSKGILNQTMTIDSGSSLSQSEVHLEVFENVVDSDADMVKDIINDQLLPRMIAHGFPVKGLRFTWDESIDFTPEQQIEIEKMLLDKYKVKPEHWIEKYQIPIEGERERAELPLARPFFD